AAEDELVLTDAELRRELRAQGEARAVRIAVDVLERAAYRFERERRRPERILVRCELDHAGEPELALELLDRFARLVRLERRDPRLHAVAQAHDPGSSPARGNEPSTRCEY